MKMLQSFRGRIISLLLKCKPIANWYYGSRNLSKKKTYVKGNDNIFKDMGLSTDIQRIVVGNNNYIENGIEANLSNTRINISGNNNRVIIGSGTCIDNSRIWIEGNNCRLIIGENVTVVGADFSIAEDDQSIEIGDDCLFAYDVEFKTSDSHSIIDLDTNERINYARSIKLENHVWLGAKASVLKGVTIGKDSIVATGAIVTRDIPANCLAAGIPAKVIKTNVTWDGNRL